MRWALLTVYLAVVGVAIWVERASDGPAEGLVVEIDPGFALPDAEDTYNRVRDRGWSADMGVIVRSPRPCARGELRAIEEGRPTHWANWSSAQPRLVVQPSGWFGGTLDVRVVASCVEGAAAGLRGTATAAVEVPDTECRAGPVRVLDVRGDAGTDGSDELRVGETVTAANVIVRRGSVVVGRPECNGFHVVLLRGKTSPGTYDPNHRGWPFRASQLVVGRADEHGGVWSPINRDLYAYPVGKSCVDCGLSEPAAYAGRLVGDRAVMRVFRGDVWVGRSAMRRLIRVRGGEQLFAHCPALESCSFGRPQIWQPREPLRVYPTKRTALTSVVEGRERPPLRRLVPHAAETDVLELGPRLLAISWWRRVRAAPEAWPEPESGFVVWRGLRTRWRLEHSSRFAEGVRARPRAVDVSRDSRPDLIVAQGLGSGACGLRQVLVDVGGRMREAFRRDMCETYIEARAGDLLVPTRIGACPVQPGSAHCYGGTRFELLRWNGTRFRTHRVWVECVQPDLDPGRDCAKRR